MNHSWQIIDEKLEVHRRLKRHNKVRIHKIEKAFECVNCGLRKGYEQCGPDWRKYYVLIYFTNQQEFLSFGTLPFKCNGIKQKSLLLTKEDFYIG